MNKIFIILGLSFVLLTIFSINITLAADGEYDLPNPLQTDSIATIIGRITKYMVGISGTIALLFFIYGGSLWLISAGRPDYVTKGRNAMVWSGIGLVVIFASYALVYLAYKIIGKA